MSNKIDWDKIKNDYRAKMSIATINKKYGVPCGAIRAKKERDNWKVDDVYAEKIKKERDRKFDKFNAKMTCKINKLIKG